jgi:hypothetical protein
MMDFLKLVAGILICIALVVAIVCVATRKHRPPERRTR